MRSPSVLQVLRPELIGLAMILPAAGLRALLNPVLGTTQVWVTFWPAMFLAAWFGGTRASLLVMGASLAFVFGWLADGSYLALERGLSGGAVFIGCGLAFTFVARQTRRGALLERGLRERAEAESRRRSALVDLSTVLAAADSVESVAQAVVTEGMRASDADTAMLYVLDEPGQQLRVAAERGVAPEVAITLTEIAVDSEHGQKLVVENWVEGIDAYVLVLPEVAGIASTHQRVSAFWSMPLRVAGRVVGVLAMGFYAPRTFDPDEREFVRLFAQHCAQAMERAERASGLAREQVRMTRLFDANLIGTVFWDKGKIDRANDSFLAMIGYSRADLEANRIDWDKQTPPEFAHADLAAIASVKARGFHEPFEKELIHRDGRRVPVLVSSAAFFDAPHLGVTYFADLTEVKRAAGLANRAKDEFLAMLGHELRNPLAPITTALELIEIRGVESSSRALGIIARQVQHLTRMVDDLLDVSRIKAGKVTITRRRTELREVIERAVEIVSPLLEERRHRLTVNVPPTGLPLDVDGTRMSQVFANILMNAAKYTDRAGQIQVAARAEGNEVSIDVIDNGVGIEPPLLPQIFDLFTQDAQTFDRSRGGLGLGLTIARTIVKLHDGDLSAHSDGKGTGSRFTVRLAKAKELTAPDAPAGQVAPIALVRGRRVLLVDDNVDAAEMLADLAEMRGHATRRAASGPDALRILEEFTPDVALLDLGLPVMDGYELAQRIRQLPGLSAIRLVAVTGYGQPSDRAKSRDAGFDLHLVKPVQIGEVLEAIEDESLGS